MFKDDHFVFVVVQGNIEAPQALQKDKVWKINKKKAHLYLDVAKKGKMESNTEWSVSK